jgi:hypothetical protein
MCGPAPVAAVGRCTAEMDQRIASLIASLIRTEDTQIRTLTAKLLRAAPTGEGAAP